MGTTNFPAKESSPIKVSSASIGSIANLCEALDISQDELIYVLTLPEREKYSEVEGVPKSDGTKRIIYNPHHALRKIQRRVNRRIFTNKYLIAWPEHLFGSIPNQKRGNGTVANKDYVSCAAVHCGAKSILKADIQDFFNNIHISYVKDIFKGFLKFDEDVSDALAKVCCRGEYIVQGALTSSYIANLCFYDIEGQVVEKLRRKGLAYTRLVDDMTISSKVSNYNFDYALHLIGGMVHAKELALNAKKTKPIYISTESLTVHGLRISFDEPRLPSSEVARIRAAVRNIESLASERDYRTTYAYRRDFNRCMGRVNKLKRVGHNQHDRLVRRLIAVLPLPAKRDIERASKLVTRLEQDHTSKADTYWYNKRYFIAHERLNILFRTFPSIAAELRSRLKTIRPNFK